MIKILTSTPSGWGEPVSLKDVGKAGSAEVKANSLMRLAAAAEVATEQQAAAPGRSMTQDRRRLVQGG